MGLCRTMPKLDGDHVHSATQAFLDTLDTLDVRRRQTAMVDLVRQTPGSGLTAVVRSLFGQPSDPVRTILDDLMTGEPIPLHGHLRARYPRGCGAYSRRTP